MKPPLKIVLVDAKFMIGPRTIPIPRSSDAFNSKTIDGNCAGVYNFLAQARIVDVFPVPEVKKIIRFWWINEEEFIYPEVHIEASEAVD